MKRESETQLERQAHASPNVVVDIGSTQIKVARLDGSGAIVSQAFHPRDFEGGIARQVESLLEDDGRSIDSGSILVCSSANGGLRVGIVCLSPHFSGATLRNQVLLAGANPLFVHTLDEQPGSLQQVDILIVGGGIDCDDAAAMERRLRGFEPQRYRYGALAYAGNARLAALFTRLFPSATTIPNPLAESLNGRSLSVFEAVRRAYLDDLVYKEGVSELRGNLAQGIRPTPEIVSRGFQRALANASSIGVSGACVVLDVGGATTDLHYTVEIVRDDSEQKPPAGVSVGRFVFTDLGIVASRDSLVLQLRHHPRLYEFLDRVLGSAGVASYQAAREGEWEPTPALLSYGCLFVALDRFFQGRGPGLPTGDPGRIAQAILTGGASQTLDEAVISRVFALFRSPESGACDVLIDRKYQLWVDGITWSGHALS
jgi:hypothetical protein